MEEKYWTLIAKQLSTEISPEERIELQRWLDRNSDNADLFEKVQKLWNISGNYDFDFQLDKEKNWEKLKAKILLEEGSSKPRSASKPRIYWLKVAAAVLLIAGVGYFLTTNNKEKPVTEAIAYIKIEASDTVHIFYLPDSTQVWLNKNSQVSYPEKFLTGERNVNLTGEAFFQVVHDATTPFIVYASGTRTKVLGTSFNVRAYENEKDVEVVLIEGKVEFNAEQGNEKVILTMNETVAYDKETRVCRKGKRKDNKAKWWKEDAGKELESVGKEIEHDVERFFKRAKNEIKKNKRKEK